MFEIKHINHQSSTEVLLQDTSKTNVARIALNLGGSLQELTLNNHKLIINQSSKYQDNYASAVLFPFTNRIKNGKYYFKDKAYQLYLNKKDENNAHHGLIYNKTFILVNQDANADFAEVTFSHFEDQNPMGFPFKYTVFLTYTLSKNKLNLKVNIKNNSNNAFPFCLGWHPYFYTQDLMQSSLQLDSDKHIELGNDMIPIALKTSVKKTDVINFKNQKFDHCYKLNNNIVTLKTPAYQLKLQSDSDTNFLQIYTPDVINTVAIEPMTAPANSFNNKIGLQFLNPEDTYSVNWNLKLMDYV